MHVCSSDNQTTIVTIIIILFNFNSLCKNVLTLWVFLLHVKIKFGTEWLSHRCDHIYGCKEGGIKKGDHTCDYNMEFCQSGFCLGETFALAGFLFFISAVSMNAKFLKE